MNLTVSLDRLRGETGIISSKSHLQRLLVCAAFADGPTVIRGADLCGDVAAAAGCVRALGAGVAVDGRSLYITPVKSPTENPLLDCGESGTALRFLLPVVAALGTGARFTGRGRLAERPLSPLYEILSENGCRLSERGVFPLRVEGRLRGGEFTVDGGVSSQFISGLLLAAPLTGETVTVTLTGRAESLPYIGMTERVMSLFGVNVEHPAPLCYRVGPGAYRSPGAVTAEGDWSNAAFWLVAAVLSNSEDFTLKGLDPSSPQGDRVIADFLRTAGARVDVSPDGVRVSREGDLRPFTADAAQCPDLVPALAVLMCGAVGVSEIRGAARLRLKESDRLLTVGNLVRALGGEVQALPEGLRIYGEGRLRGGTVDAAGDHRIAMAAAAAAPLCREPVRITGAEAADKSYPGFFDTFRLAGAGVTASEQRAG